MHASSADAAKKEWLNKQLKGRTIRKEEWQVFHSVTCKHTGLEIGQSFGSRCFQGDLIFFFVLNFFSSACSFKCTDLNA